MTGPRRKNVGSRDMMSVYPPRTVGPALGGYRSVTMSTGLRVAAHVLGEANIAVSKKLTEREWNYVYQSLIGRNIDPEVARPNGLLSELVTTRHTHFGLGVELDPKNPGQAVEALARKLQDLDYLQSWAVIIACKWREENCPDECKPEWWTLKHRASNGS